MMDATGTAIIGAGASGLAAAVCAGRCGESVTVYEHKPEAGLKLLITGHGKCNLTNRDMSADYFRTENPELLKAFLGRFGVQDVTDFFESVGVKTHDRSGYVYPVTDDARTVRDALLREAERLGVSFRMNCGDIDIDKLRSTYDKVILACGSSACKKTGSNGSGYKLLEKLGVRYTRILPALCPVYVDDNDFCRDNTGKRIIATVRAAADGMMLAEDTGEIQIRRDSLSGVPVLQISRFVSQAYDEGKRCTLILDTAPDRDRVPEMIRDRYTDSVAAEYSFTVNRISRFDHAQVCMGGVPLDALTESFELKNVPGVYVIGELCDVDGICGGYNLHWAWLSANLCGR